MESKSVAESKNDDDHYYIDNDDATTIISTIYDDSDYKLSIDDLSPGLKEVLKNNGSFSSVSSDSKIDWEAPKLHGLSNSDAIIPHYYFKESLIKKNPNNLIDIKYLTVVRDDIRNYRKLSDNQVDYICNLDVDNKNELIKLLIEVNGGLIEMQS